MAKKKHLKTLRRGVEAWNVWREKNPDARPDLRDADLTDADLTDADLTHADLTHADLSSTLSDSVSC